MASKGTKSTDKSHDDGIPSELKGRLGSFDAAVSSLDSVLQPLLSVSHSDLVEKLGPLDCAKMDLVAAYSINSLFWMYLNTCGVNPKDHPVKQELERIRSYMSRVKEAQERLNAPRVDKGAAKRFIKSALWQAAHKKDDSESASAVASQSDRAEDSANSTQSSKKRKHKD